MRKTAPSGTSRLSCRRFANDKAIARKLKKPATQRKQVLSGELGYQEDPILAGPASVREVDLVMLESTYGNRCHRSPVEIDRVMSDALKEQGNILMPAIARKSCTCSADTTKNGGC